MSSKRLYPTKFSKYLGMRINGSLYWNEQINNIAINLSQANALFYKVRTFVNTRIPKSIYHAIFDCHLNYENIVWFPN